MTRRAVLLLTLLLLPWPATAQAAPAVLLSEVHPDPASGEREFVELHNTGDTDLDLTGWRIEDAAGNAYTFAGPVLAPDAFLVLWGGGASDALGPAWSRATVWNNAGDDVRLLRPDGTLQDHLAYGDAPGATVAAPVTGRSLALGDAWGEADPTPGYQAGVTGGTVSGTVPALAPDAQWTDAVDRVRTGRLVSLSFRVFDPNGDALHWTVADAGGTVADGLDAGDHPLDLTAPGTPGVWILSLSATDVDGTVWTNRTLRVADTDLGVTLPPGGVTFGDLVPGGGPVDATAVTLQNLGDAELSPWVDISDLRGPGGATLPMAGRLIFGIDDGTAVTWVPYDGPLTTLPGIPPGAAVQVTFRLADVPAPLPAGDYATSFTVTAP